MEFNPAESPTSDADDLGLVRQAQDGDRETLESHIRWRQSWICIVHRMRYWPHEAEDTGQEIPVGLIAKLPTCQGRSSLRPWLYRIVVNHLLNQKRHGWEHG